MPSHPAHHVVAIAASAGGVEALKHILAALPSNFPAAIAIVQHISSKHPSFLAKILNRHTSLEVKEAESGDLLCPAMVFTAPPNLHLLVNPGGITADCRFMKYSSSRR